MRIRQLLMKFAKKPSTRVACCHARGFSADQGRATTSGRKGQLDSGKSHTDVITCFPHSSTPKRPSICAFQEAKGRKDRVDVITAKPEMSPEYTRSLSPEMNRELMAELCERIIWSGGGAEAILGEEDMLKGCLAAHSAPFGGSANRAANRPQQKRSCSTLCMYV